MNERNPSPAGDASYRAIEEKAAEWFGRCEIGLTPDQEREFVRWLETDPRHGEAMREMDDTWELLDRLQESRVFRLITPIKTIWRQMAPILAATAAALILGVGYWQYRTAAALVQQHIVTEASGMKKVDLPDGSTLRLNANSSVDLLFTAQERRIVLLRGEAHFAVVKDRGRRFVVEAGKVAVRAVGTEFNVRLAAQGIEVLVTEGKVQLDDVELGASLLPAQSPPLGEAPKNAGPRGPATPLLVAGQSARVPLPASDAPVERSSRVAVVADITTKEIAQVLAWQIHQLEFDETPLADVVADFNRYNSHQLVIEDPELARQPFGGSFRADNQQVFVQLLEDRFNVVAERSAHQTVLRSRNR